MTKSALQNRGSFRDAATCQCGAIDQSISCVDNEIKCLLIDSWRHERKNTRTLLSKNFDLFLLFKNNNKI